jgi:hypothetical protein
LDLRDGSQPGAGLPGLMCLDHDSASIIEQ